MKTYKEFLEENLKTKPANWDPENVIPCARCGHDIDFNDEEFELEYQSIEKEVALELPEAPTFVPRKKQMTAV